MQNSNLKATLRNIPPSTEHLFDKEKLLPVTQSLGGLQTWLNKPTYLKEKQYKGEHSKKPNRYSHKNSGKENKNKTMDQNTFRKRKIFRSKKNGSDESNKNK